MHTINIAVPRFLRQNKAFAACVIASLGVGISASSSVVALVDSVQHGRLPFANADRIEMLYIGGRPLRDRSYLLDPEIARALEAKESPLEAVALMNFKVFNISERDRSVVAFGYQVSPSFPRMFSARMHLGRPFSESDPDDERPIMLSHGLWTSDFAGDSSIVGRTIQIDSLPFTVVGITAPGWAFPDRSSAWVMSRTLRTGSGFKATTMVAGLRKPDVEAGRAQVMIAAMGTGAMTRKSFPKDRIESESLRTHLTLRLSTAIFVLGLVALFLAFITAVNFAGLVLARGIKRRAELGVRAALGASVTRLVREIVAESLWLCAAGGVLAAVLAPGVSNMLRLSFGNDLPAWVEFGLSWRVFAASMAMAVLLGLVFSIGPGLDLARPALVGFLRSGGTGTSGGAGAARSRAGLVSVQVALATGVLVLLGSIFGRVLVLAEPQPGFDYASVVGGSISMSGRFNQPKMRAASANVLASVQATPGISSAAILYSQYVDAIQVKFNAAEDYGPAARMVWWAQTSDDFHKVVGSRLVVGRLPTLEEFRGAAPVAVVSRELAHRVYADRALGQTIAIEGARLTIVGVIENIERGAFNPQASLTVLSPVLEGATWLTFTEVWARAAAVTQVRPVIRELQERARRDYAVRVDFVSLGDRMREQMRSFAAIARVIWGIFAVALGLAALGIYGMVAYTAEMRSREMAIREALGASRTRVAALLLRSAAFQTALGFAGGGVLATVGAYYMRSRNMEPATAMQSNTLAAVFLVVTVVLSSLGPLRATWRRDLSSVLRQ